MSGSGWRGRGSEEKFSDGISSSTSRGSDSVDYEEELFVFWVRLSIFKLFPQSSNNRKRSLKY